MIFSPGADNGKTETKEYEKEEKKKQQTRRTLITRNVHKAGIRSAEQSDIITESNIDFHESFLAFLLG